MLIAAISVSYFLVFLWRLRREYIHEVDVIQRRYGIDPFAIIILALIWPFTIPGRAIKNFVTKETPGEKQERLEKEAKERDRKIKRLEREYQLKSIEGIQPQEPIKVKPHPLSIYKDGSYLCDNPEPHRSHSWPEYGTLMLCKGRK